MKISMIVERETEGKCSFVPERLVIDAEYDTEQQGLRVLSKILKEAGLFLTKEN